MRRRKGQGAPSAGSASPRAPSRALSRLALLAAPALAACGAAEPAPPPRGAPEPAGAAPPFVAQGPARYVAPPEQGLVERVAADGGGQGVDRVVLDGRRLELYGLERMEPVGSGGPELTGGAAFPSWSGARAGAGAPPAARYLFWSGSDVYAAESFSGELRKLAALPGDVVSAFPWLDGIGLITTAGSFAVRGGSGDLRPLGLPSIVAAAAASERRALGLTAFGRAILTLDAGASYRDVTAELGDAIALDVRGDEIVVTLDGGLERAIDPSGRPGAPRAPRAPPPVDVEPGWLRRAPFALLADAVASGLPLPDGGAVLAADGVVGRIDLATGRATSAAALPPGSGECAPFRAHDALLAVCAGPDRASVVDLSAGDAARALRIERTFELRAGTQRDEDRFVGVDGEALGYVGPCEGPPRPQLDLDAISRGAIVPGSTQRSAVFCVRRGPGAWVEHHLDPADATFVFAWIPRRGGGAVALVARPGAFLRDGERVEARGALRVVRLARGEPPLSLSRYAAGSPELLSRALVALADGAVEGWLPAPGSAGGLAPFAIDAAGRLRRRPLPERARTMAASGRFALVETERGELFETTDRGERWVPVAPPPGSAPASPAWSSSPASSSSIERCSAVGCRVGAFLRLGWASAAPSAAAPGAAHPPGAVAPEPLAAAAPARGAAGRGVASRAARPVPPPPLARLACTFAGPVAAARVPESYGFGAVAARSPALRTSPLRLGTLGALTLPASIGAPLAPGADAELAWIAPLDARAEIRRASVPLPGAGLASLVYRPYEAQLGFVIDGGGRVAPVAVGPEEVCLADLLDAARVTRPIGGCAPRPSVGVDLGDRVVLLSPWHDRLAVLAAELRGGAGPRRAGPAGAPHASGAAPPALRELYVQRTARDVRTAPEGAPFVHGAGARFVYGAGARASREPVFVAVDGAGGAVLSPVDPERGTFGPEEALAPLGEIVAGNDPRCAPRRDEARVVLPFASEIGLDPGTLPGITGAGTAGVAVIRWSRDRACLDAVEINVRDERYEPDLGYYEPAGTVKKLIARFAGPSPVASLDAPGGLADRGARGRPDPARAVRAEPARAAGAGTLVLVLHGQEIRQPVRCAGVAR
ncbi:hypothetical protein [Sorangium sp. So ce131]|uniref:hypothetical protein n=1 Tax=Sorangium sp. So ce131 TaxID=3133282 RepID=UPI003F5FCE6D